MERWSKGKKNNFLTPIMDQLEEIILCFKFSEAFFLKNTKTIELFLEINIIKQEINCMRGDGRMRIMVVATYIDGYAYRCSSKACRSKASPKKGSKMAIPNMEFVKILRKMYCWAYDYTLARVIDFCDCAETAYIKIKDLILQVIFEQEPEMVKTCGEGIGMQFDETAIYNGELIPDPSSTLDNKPSVQWLVGGVEEGNCRNFVIKLVPDIKVPTILDMFEEYVVPGSIIVTDGYPSYLRVVT